MPDSGRIREMCDLRKVYRRSKKYYVTVAGEMTTASPKGDNGKFRDLPDKFGFKDDRKAPYSKEYRNWLVSSGGLERSGRTSLTPDQLFNVFQYRLSASESSRASSKR